MPPDFIFLNTYCSASKILCLHQKDVFLWIPHISAVLRIDKPFTTHLIYLIQTQSSFCVPDVIEFVLATNDLLLSLQIYLYF